MKKDKMYFGEEGITSTHASHIANICSEIFTASKVPLDKIELIDSEISLISSTTKHSVSVGVKNLEFIEVNLGKAIAAASLSAWLHEAIKAKENMISEVKLATYSLDSAAQKGIIELPVTPVRAPQVTDEDIIKEMSMEERVTYLMLETRAAQIGKLIHPDGSFAKARNKALEVQAKPCVTMGEGTNITIVNRKLSLSAEDINNEFFALQNAHRQTQSKLNQIKSDIKKKVNDLNLKANNEFAKELNVYSAEISKVTTELEAFSIKELAKIAALKIVIPSELQPLFNELDLVKK